MNEGAQVSAQEVQNGRRLDPRHLAAAPIDEERSAPGGDAEEVLSRARAQAQALTARAQADAEDLLSRAQSQVELLRVHAEAVRAEAECLRAEAAALRTAARDEVEKAGLHADSTTQKHATADKLLAAVEDEVDAARDEFERMRTEALSIRRLLRAEIDAGLADVQKLGGEVQRLSAKTDELAAELRLLLPRPGAAGVTEDPLVDARARAATDVPPEAAHPPQEEQMAELLRKIWDAASPEARNVPARRSSGEPATPTVHDAWGGGEPAPGVQPTDRQAEPPAASQPLIGSGGWGAREASLPYTGSAAGQRTPPSASKSRRRRRRG